MGNVATALWAHAESTPDKTAISGSGRELTYGALRQRASDVAAALAAAGVSPGDRVLLVAPSVPEFAPAVYGIHASGAIAVTVNTMSTPDEIDYVLGDAGCSLVLAWVGTDESARKAAAGRGLDCWLLEPGLPDVPGAADLPTPVARDASDTALLLYTSGTTGRPKGAELTHGNLVTCSEAFVGVTGVTPEDRLGTALPLFHVFGQSVVMGLTFHVGATLFLVTPFEANAVLDLIRDERITFFSGVPTMYNAMLHAEREAGPDDYASLRLCTSGGASLPAEVIKAFGEKFGTALLEGYGLTETTGAATFNGLDRERKPGFVGIALPGMQVKVTDDDGNEVPRGTPGEVRVLGPQVMARYWGRPEASAEALHDRWLLTGDVGRMDESGDLEIVDRKKDLVIRGGYNVYPREVEEVLYSHPDVVEAAVIGVPDAHWGEEVGAVVVLRAGAELDSTVLRAWLKERLSAYKVPRLFAVVDELPKGGTGKILKRSIDRELLHP